MSAAYTFDMQAVHELYEVTEGAAWGGGSERGTRVVVIGCRLQPSKLDRDLQQCLA
jgi:G3E family GTPase